jgi:hypothetical protein
MWYLYLDESGDLGFDFSRKRPSVFLTIAVLAIKDRETADCIRNAARRTLRNKINRGRERARELKGSSTSIEVKRYFYRQVRDCTFEIYSVTLNKRRALAELGQDASIKSRLYNFLACRVLEGIPLEMAGDLVQLVVDKSKNQFEMAEFNDYVLANLKGRIDPRVAVKIYHHDSYSDPGLSAVDLFCWGVFRKHERSDEEWYGEYRDKVIADLGYP